MPAGSELLVCPGCGASRPAAELFCPDCRLPLVYDPDQAVPVKLSERRSGLEDQAAAVGGRAGQGRVGSQSGRGRVHPGPAARGGSPEHAPPQCRFDVPDFLAAGPRDVLVARSGESTARQVLLEAEIVKPGSTVPQTAPVRMFAGMLVALVAASLILWLLYEVLR